MNAFISHNGKKCGKLKTGQAYYFTVYGCVGA